MKYIISSEVRNLKEVARNLYQESRKFPGTKEEKDTYLDVLIEKFVEKAFEREIKADTDINRDNIAAVKNAQEGYLKEFIQLMNKWKNEFESGKKWWEIWKS